MLCPRCRVGLLPKSDLERSQAVARCVLCRTTWTEELLHWHSIPADERYGYRSAPAGYFLTDTEPKGGA